MAPTNVRHRSVRRAALIGPILALAVLAVGLAGVGHAQPTLDSAAEPSEGSPGKPVVDPVRDTADEDRYQRVSYDMDITLKTDRHHMIGQSAIEYHNLSPDTLRTVYFHLYFNAFHPSSMMAHRNRDLPDPDSRIVPRIFNLGPEEQGYHRIRSLTQDGEALEYRVFATVLEAELADPLAPGESTEFELDFRSQVPLQTRRSGRDNREGIDYSMSQWYPKIAKYDDSGWHPDPYVNREFYAPFGDFDVSITLPAEFKIGATGRLVNPEAVGHGYADTSQTGPATDADSLTWRFRARRVHDFAWAADPDFLHDTVTGPMGTRIHLLYQPGVAEGWAPMRSWVPGLLGFYSRQYGTYPYRQFTVVQAGDGGMEYPQIVFLTGRRSPSSLLGVTAHEMAHQWYYLLLATNESDYAWMDEGFTSYAETEAMSFIRSRMGGGSSDPSAPTHRGAYLNWLYHQHTGLAERLNTPADWFRTNRGYVYASYVGGEMVVDMLGGVISDSLRDRWLRAYYEEYKFDHPDPADVERLAEEVSGMRLDWFFEQLTETTRECDYALADWSVSGAESGHRLELVLEREAPMVMPVDVRVDLENGESRWIHVPRGISFGHKPVPEDWTVTDPWPWTQRTDTLRIETSARPVGAELDPKGNLPDRDRLDNRRRFPVDYAFLRPPSLDWFDYSVGWRPSLAYAHDFGPGLGLQARGEYLFGTRRLEAKLRLWPRVLFSGGEEPALRIPPTDLSTLDGLNYDLSFSDPVPRIGRPSQLRMRARNHLGVLEHSVSIERRLDPHAPLGDSPRRLRLSLTHQHQYSDRSYDLAPDFSGWEADHLWSAAARYGASRPHLRYRIFGEVGAELGASFLDDPEPSLRLRSDAELFEERGPWRFGTRVSIGLGGPDLVTQRRYRLGSVSAEARWQADPIRSLTALFEEPRREMHLAAFGHAGPVAYLRSRAVPGGTPMGRNLAAGTAYLEVQPFAESRILEPLRAGVYAASGTVWNQGSESIGAFLDERLGALLHEGGLALSYDVGNLGGIDRWRNQSSVLSGLDLSARLPVWVSDPDRIDPGSEAVSLSGRWLLGIRTEWQWP